MGFRVVVRSTITPVRGDHMHDMHGSVFDGLHVIILTRSLSPYKCCFVLCIVFVFVHQCMQRLHAISIAMFPNVNFDFEVNKCMHVLLFQG